MTFEFIFYILLISFGAFFCFYDIRDKVYNAITFILFLGFSIVVRNAGYDYDIQTYVDNFYSDDLSFHYIKEPVFWLGSRLLYVLFSSEEMTLVVYDALSFLILLYVRQKWQLPKYFPFLWLCFFPLILGMQNVYRQYLSYQFILLFLYFSLVSKSYIVKGIMLLLAALCHNVALLFAPVIYTFNSRKKVSWPFILTSCIILILLPFAAAFKSKNETGVLGAEIYLLVMLMFLLIYTVLHRGVFNGIFAKFYYLQFYFIALTGLSIILMGNAQAKRIGMYCLLLSLIPVVLTIEEKIKNKRLIRFSFLMLMIIPTFLFSSTMSMLLTK